VKSLFYFSVGNEKSRKTKKENVTGIRLPVTFITQLEME
jgi:hypothetical protein